MPNNQEITAKEKLLLMIDTLSDNYAIRVIDYIKGLRAGENIATTNTSEEKKGA